MTPAPIGLDALVGLVVALLCAGVFAARCDGASLGWLLRAWGDTALIVVPFVVAMRRARFSARALSASATGALVAALPAALVGAILAARTHHRALGAVTFAVAALVIWALSTAVALRVSFSASRLSRIAPFALAALSVLAVATVGVARVRASFGVEAAAEVLIVGAAVALSIRVPRLDAPRWGGVAGVLTWAVVVLAGLMSRRVNPPPGDACRPLFEGRIHGHSRD